ncbi:MAG TPA: hypothetical protein VLI68_11350, partial [Hanamia sp.]|nr:hypothetical protein [Hanamia sp.]
MKPPILKYPHCFLMHFFLLMFLFPATVFSQKKYSVQYVLAGKDTSSQVQQFDFKTIFETRESAEIYISKLPEILLNKGFPTASVDSVFYDSTHATVKLYIGTKYKWAQISTDSIDRYVLDNSGWSEKQFENKNIDFSRLRLQEKKIIEYYENSGYPFAAVSLKDIEINDDKIKAKLHVTKGPLYHIDSIHIVGKVKIKNLFLQHYLDIYNGSVYNNEKLQQINKLIRDLPFLQEQQSWDVSMLGTGATVNLYLEPKRSSQINVLIGFVPGNTITGKAQITADVHLDLKNALGNGESILLNWQQLQPQSPRLNLGFSKPYIFNS